MTTVPRSAVWGRRWSGAGPYPTQVTPAVDLVRARAVADPGKPVLTWYDIATGERVELSGATLINWVNKTANFFSGDLGLGPANRVSIRLPRHWLAAVCWVAAESVGAEPTFGSDPLADLAVIGPADLTAPPPNDEVVAVSLRPMGAAFDQPLPRLIRDFTLEVRPQPDQFSPQHRIGIPGQNGLADFAQWALTPADRVGAAGPWLSGVDPAASLLAPLAAGASLVWVWNPTPEALVSLIESEGVTAWVGEPPIGAVLPSVVRVLGLPSVS